MTQSTAEAVLARLRDIVEVDALNRVADTKGISRNALIVQALVKLFKRHIEEAK